MDERAKLIARQGHAFATSQDVRVVYHTDEHNDGKGEHGRELVDVPADGKTMGEIITRGNIVMKEVSPISNVLLALRWSYGCEMTIASLCFHSTSVMKKQQRKLSMVDGSIQVILRSCIRTGVSQYKIGARTSLFPEARYVDIVKYSARSSNSPTIDPVIRTHRV